MRGINRLGLSIRAVVLVLGLSQMAGCSSFSLLPASIDGDRDGVRDRMDSCEGTNSQLTVDRNGCVLFQGVVKNLNFAPDQVSLDVAGREALDELVLKLKRFPDVSIAVESHTDNRGNARDNLELSKRRVTAVVRYLVIKGIDGSRLFPHGYGESRPLASNATQEGRKRNRRIEISERLPIDKLQ